MEYGRNSTSKIDSLKLLQFDVSKGIRHLKKQGVPASDTTITEQKL